MLTRREMIKALAGIAASLPLSPQALAAGVSRALTKEEAITRTVKVPFDHAHPGGGTFELEYYLRRAFDPAKPTIFVVGDGQQFFIRKDLAVDWAARFGDGSNVVAVAGRGFAKGIQDRLGVPKGDEWAEAYRLLRYKQWTDDIERIRIDLLGEDARIRIWGGSGGGQLVHQYLSQHGGSVSHVFTESAYNPFLDAQFGFDSDHFWREISEGDRVLLQKALTRPSADRQLWAMLLQRQNFFVPLNMLDAARHDLIADIVAGRQDVLTKLREDYQVDAIQQLLEGPLAAPIRVRLYECYAPLAHRFGDRAIFRPDLETSEATARPLMELRRQGKIPEPTMDFRPLHRIEVEVTLLAGYGDHTVDYRSQIALSSHYPYGKLILLDDDHMFARLDEMGDAKSRLLSAALIEGRKSADFAKVMQRIAPLEWREA